MDKKHCCTKQRAVDTTPPSSPSVHKTRDERLECKLRRLNVIYRWDRLLQPELLPPPPRQLRPLLSPPPPSSTNSTSLLANPAVAAPLSKVTKRSGRRRRRQRIGGFDALDDGGRDLQLASWPPWDEGLSGAAGGVGDASLCSKQP